MGNMGQMGRMGHMAAVFVLAAVMPCAAQQIPSRLKWEGRNVAWWEKNETPESWVRGAVRIENTLLAAQKKHGMEKMMRNRGFISWMLHLRWLKLFPADWQQHHFFGDPVNRRAYVAVACEKELPALFLAALAPEDDDRAALEILCRIYRSHLILQWARMNEESDFYREAVVLARKAMPSAIRPWELEAAWLSSNKTPPEERRVFWNAWIKNFRQNKDLKVRGQIGLLRVLEELGAKRDAEKLEKQIITENRSSRFDLGIRIASEAVFERLQRHQWREAEKELENVMRRFRQKAGGHLFYALVQPYVTICIQERQTAMALKASGHLRHFNARKGTMLDSDISQLRARVTAAARGVGKTGRGGT